MTQPDQHALQLAQEHGANAAALASRVCCGGDVWLPNPPLAAREARLAARAAMRAYPELRTDPLAISPAATEGTGCADRSPDPGTTHSLAGAGGRKGLPALAVPTDVERG